MSNLHTELCRDIFDYLDRPNLDKLHLVCHEFNDVVWKYYQKAPIRLLNTILVADHRVTFSSIQEGKEKDIFRSGLTEMLDHLKPKYVRFQKFLLLCDDFLGIQDLEELTKCIHTWTDASFSLSKLGDTPISAPIYQQIFTSIAICRQLNVPIAVDEEIAPTFLQLPAFANAQKIHFNATIDSQNVVELLPKQILEWCKGELKPCAFDNNHRKEMIVDFENVRKGLKHLVRLLVKDFESSTKCTPYFLAFRECAKIPSSTIQLHNVLTGEMFEAFTPTSINFSSALENISSLQQFEYIIVRGKSENISSLSN